MKRTALKKRSSKTLPKLKKEAEKWFHQYIRLRDCLKTTGTLHHCICFTCERDTQLDTLNAGHFQHGKLDFDEDNLHGQCVGCNKWGHGKLDLYTLKMIKEYGQEFVDDLMFRSHTEEKHPRSFYEEKIVEYKQKVINFIGEK